MRLCTGKQEKRGGGRDRVTRAGGGRQRQDEDFRFRDGLEGSSDVVVVITTMVVMTHTPFSQISRS